MAKTFGGSSPDDLGTGVSYRIEFLTDPEMKLFAWSLS